MVDKLLVSIVLYKQRLKDSPSYISLTNSLNSLSICTLFVYDNSPHQQVIPTKLGNWQIIYIHNPRNDGISKAYNTAAEFAEKLNKEWLLFIDQDTVFPENFLQTLLKSIQENSNIHIFSPILRSGEVVVSPCWIYFEKGFKMTNPQTGVQEFKNKLIINSGLCVSLIAFKLSGGYNNNIKLDFSDHYFINKLKKNYKLFYVIEARVEHSLSTFTNNYKSTISRFKYYCDGARHSSDLRNFILLFIVCTLRMLKLTFLNRTLKFINIYFKYYIFQGSL